MPTASRSLLNASTPRWDICIDLTGSNTDIRHPLPSGLVDRVRQAVEALPGAGYVSVEVHAEAPSHLRWLVLYPVGNALSQQGPEWAERHDVVEQAVRMVAGVW